MRDEAVLTLYTGQGLAFPGLSPLVVFIPESPGGGSNYSRPTGIVFNGTKDFDLAPGVPSRLLIITLDGSIVGWSSVMDQHAAALLVDNSPEAEYTGAAIARLHDENALFVANFRQGRIDVFGPDFGPLFLGPSAFHDPLVPSNFSPYNIQNVNGELYVTFAMSGTDGRTAMAGEALGYVDVFHTTGDLVMRLESGPWMNAPWGIALAPIGFGAYGGFVLVGNSGSGSVSVFHNSTGSFAGYLQDAHGKILTFPGLHALAFGNDGLAGPSTALYFTSGHDNDGLNIVGIITHGAIQTMQYSAAPTKPYVPY